MGIVLNCVVYQTTVRFVLSVLKTFLYIETKGFESEKIQKKTFEKKKRNFTKVLSFQQNIEQLEKNKRNSTSIDHSLLRNPFYITMVLWTWSPFRGRRHDDFIRCCYDDTALGDSFCQTSEGCESRLFIIILGKEYLRDNGLVRTYIVLLFFQSRNFVLYKTFKKIKKIPVLSVNFLFLRASFQSLLVKLTFWK